MGRVKRKDSSSTKGSTVASTATLHTNHGDITLNLFEDQAPKTVANFVGLANGTKEYADPRTGETTTGKFYDGLVFHRVIDGFMAQGGDPKGDGTGGSDLPNVPAEFNYLPHVRGSVAAARADDPNSANSQFYIVFQPRFALDKKYTVFGRVLDGMQYVDAIERGEPPANPSRIVHAYIASDNPPAFVPLAPTPAPSLGAHVTLPGATPATPARRPAPKAAPAKKAATATK